MPDSMMSAPTGGRLNVSGSSIAIDASGPMPGSTPTSVPTKTPAKQYIRFVSETAVVNPSVRLGKFSAKNSMSELPPEEAVGQAQAVNEQPDRTGHQPCGEDEGLDGLELPPGQRREQNEDHERDYKARLDLFHQQPEERECAHQHEQRTLRPRLDPVARYAQRPIRDHRTHEHEQSAEIRGEISGAHSHCRAHRVIARDHYCENAESYEHQAGVEVLLAPYLELHGQVSSVFLCVERQATAWNGCNGRPQRDR